MRSSSVLLAALALTAQLPAGLAAQTADDLPNFTYDDAVNCLAYKVAQMEYEPSSNAADDAVELEFWERLIAVKGSPEEAAAYDADYAEALAQARSVQDAEGMTADEADQELTMMGQFCWFQALAVPGVGPFADE